MKTLAAFALMLVILGGVAFHLGERSAAPVFDTAIAASTGMQQIMDVCAHTTTPDGAAVCTQIVAIGQQSLTQATR